MSKLAVIVEPGSGNVLGVVADRAAGDEAPAIEAVVGAALELRDPETGGATVTFPAADLEVQSVDAVDELLQLPLRYAVVDGQAEEQDDPGNALTKLDGTDVEITLPANATENLEVLVVVEGGDVPVRKVKTIEIAAGSKKSSGSLSLGDGTYGVVVLIPGFRTLYSTKDLP